MYKERIVHFFAPSMATERILCVHPHKFKKSSCSDGVTCSSVEKEACEIDARTKRLRAQMSKVPVT